MWTGRQTLGSIESKIAELHGEESQLDRSLRSAVSDIEQLRKDRSQGLRELARIKLDELTAGRLVGNLDAGERRAQQILDEYRLRIAAATEQREALQKEVASVEALRHTAAAAVEAALEAVDTLRAQAEAKVHSTQEWREAKAVRDQAEAIAFEAEKKAAASEAELGAKKKPYDEDRLFAYLWRRRFGTSQYSANFIVRAFDRKVAAFIGYDGARPNYAALIEIPLRLREHASAQRAAVAQPQTMLAEIERRAMLEAGVDAKEKVLAEARHKLAVADDTVEKKRDMLRKLDEARNALVAGNSDPAYNEALTTIAAADSADSLATLYAEARRTPTRADEAVVGQLEATEAKIAKTEAEIASLRRAALELSRRRSEMEQVRGRFRSTGYDHPRSTFDNERQHRRCAQRRAGGSGQKRGALGCAAQELPATHHARQHGLRRVELPLPVSAAWRRGPDATGGDWRNPSSRGGWGPRPSGSRSDDDKFSTGGSF